MLRDLKKEASAVKVAEEEKSANNQIKPLLCSCKRCIKIFILATSALPVDPNHHHQHCHEKHRH